MRIVLFLAIILSLNIPTASFAQQFKPFSQIELNKRYRLVEGEKLISNHILNNKKLSPQQLFKKYNLKPTVIPKNATAINFKTPAEADRFLSMFFSGSAPSQDVATKTYFLPHLHPIKESMLAKMVNGGTYQERLVKEWGFSRLKIGAHISWNKLSKSIISCKAHMFHEGFTVGLKFSQKYAYCDPLGANNVTMIRGGGDLEYYVIVGGIGTIATRFIQTHFKYIVK